MHADRIPAGAALPRRRRRLSGAGIALGMVLLALVLVPRWSNAAVMSFTGTFTNDDDVHTEPFTLASQTQVSARTFSYAGGVNGSGASIPAGGFAPILSLFLGSGAQDLLQVDTGSTHACADPGAGAIDPTSGFCWDAFFNVVLPPGNYIVALSQDDNPPIGPTFPDGFLQTGNPNYTGVDVFGNPSLNFISVTGEQRTGNWAFDLSLAPLQSVPEPSSLALLALGLAGLGCVGRGSFRARRAV